MSDSPVSGGLGVVACCLADDLGDVIAFGVCAL